MTSPRSIAPTLACLACALALCACGRDLKSPLPAVGGAASGASEPASSSEATPPADALGASAPFDFASQPASAAN